MSRPINHTYLSYLLVLTQLLCLGGLLITGPLLASGIFTVGMELAGLALGLWALVAMTIRNLNIFPDVRPGTQLITHGPYRYIRHPMYSALLFMTLALVLDSFSGARLILWTILLTDLWLKLKYEERQLARKFEDYNDYQQRTKRLIPFLF